MIQPLEPSPSANERTQQFIEQQAAQARGDVQNIFPTASQNLQAGFGAAADVFGQVIPQQVSAAQQGNMAAQQQMAAALPQIQNAILGLPTDFSAFQPQGINVDTSFAQTPMPQFQPAQAQQPQQQQQPQIDLAALLSGLNIGGF